MCFKDYTIEDIMAGKEEGRSCAKNWFRQQSSINKTWCDKVLSRWKKESQENADKAKAFIRNFFNRAAKIINLYESEKYYNFSGCGLRSPYLKGWQGR